MARPSHFLSSITAHVDIGAFNDGLTLAHWQDSRYFEPTAYRHVPPVVLIFSEFVQDARVYKEDKDNGFVAHQVPWSRKTLGSATNIQKATAYARKIMAIAQANSRAVLLLDDRGEGAALLTAVVYLMDKHKWTLERVLAPLMVNSAYLEGQSTSPHVGDMFCAERTIHGAGSIMGRSLEIVMGQHNIRLGSPEGKMRQRMHETYLQSLRVLVENMN
jgi:hypothetical protein